MINCITFIPLFFCKSLSGTGEPVGEALERCRRTERWPVHAGGCGLSAMFTGVLSLPPHTPHQPSTPHPRPLMLPACGPRLYRQANDRFSPDHFSPPHPPRNTPHTPHTPHTGRMCQDILRTTTTYDIPFSKQSTNSGLYRAFAYPPKLICEPVAKRLFNKIIPGLMEPLNPLNAFLSPTPFSLP